MKDLKIYLFIASALLVIYLVAQYNRPQPVNWSASYDRAEKMPFGTYVLFNRLHDIFPGTIIKTQRDNFNAVVKNNELKNSTYVIICDAFNFNEADYNELKQYVSEGNDVFIAASDFGILLRRKLEIQTASEVQQNSQTYVNFTQASLKDQTYLIEHGSSNQYFSSFDTVKAKVLGQNGYNHASFLKIPMGKGNLLLNANPQMFTNYSLLQSRGNDYAAKALSYAKVQPGLIWDEYYTKGKDGDQSTMRVFLSHEPLRWAFYLVFWGLIIFVVYQSKRRQRIIPVIEPVANTTVQFATVVGQVYYEQRDNKNIAHKKVTYFLEFIRSTYGLKTNVHDADFIKTLSLKSGADTDLLQNIFYQVGLIQNGEEIKDNDLITFNHNLEQFYIQSS